MLARSLSLFGVFVLWSGCAADGSVGSTGTSSRGHAVGSDDLLSAIGDCTSDNEVSDHEYSTRNGQSGICAVNGAIFFNADMDIDCDGVETDNCNGDADPDFQN